MYRKQLFRYFIARCIHRRGEDHKIKFSAIIFHFSKHRRRVSAMLRFLCAALAKCENMYINKIIHCWISNLFGFIVCSVVFSAIVRWFFSLSPLFCCCVDAEARPGHLFYDYACCKVKALRSKVRTSKKSLSEIADLLLEGSTMVPAM